MGETYGGLTFLDLPNRVLGFEDDTEGLINDE